MTTRQRRAVSPVIATVILIAVAVALGIAVAFWASGLTSSFSKYEKLGVNTQYAVSGVPSTVSCGANDVCWTVNLGGQNTGSSDATITQIQINGVPYSLTNSTSPSTLTWISWRSFSGSTTNEGTNTLSVPSGYSFSIALVLDSGSSSPSINGKNFASGQTIQVTIITAAGNNYPASIVLP